MNSDRRWYGEAMAILEAEAHRSSDTHLIRLDLPAFPGIPLYLKDESTHPTGSLKHRLGRSLFLYALCNGWLRPGRPVIEASSGSTAISAAYFARLLGLPFIAVLPPHVSPEKLEAIDRQGGRWEFADNGDLYGRAASLACETGGHYLDQFTYAERATDWRGNNNIAASMFAQLAREPAPIPRWIVLSAGTGGTAATVGRYLRYGAARGTSACRLCVADPEGSVFFDHFRTGDPGLRTGVASRIEGIGRPRVEPSFLPGVIDAMIQPADAASLAALGVIESLLGRRVGGSTGTNVVAALWLMCRMRAEGVTGSVVTLIGDGGERYRTSYYSPRWLEANGLLASVARWTSRLAAVVDGAGWPTADEAQLPFAWATDHDPGVASA